MNWHSSIQYELSANYLLEVSYQASAGNGLVERWQANTFPLDYAANDPVLRNQVFAAPQNYRPWTQLAMCDSAQTLATQHSTRARLSWRSDSLKA